ncbi:MAG: hypothetical protein H6765_03480 [Candidatus Peribacteria bacterium]|nr:MAG: hypothetical protein H6765_03480 [Candidatus Peribacteria bacterium]
MKILSNFDTRLSQTLLKNYTEQYGEGKVLLVRKSKLFYYQYIGLPWFGYFVLLCLAFFFIYGLDNLSVYVEIAFWVVFLLLFLATLHKTM